MVHRSIASMHGPPSLPVCSSHMPVIGLQVATWQSFDTGKKKQSSMVPPTQLPLLHVEPLRHRLLGSWQGAPFIEPTSTHESLSSSQEISLHWPGVMPQSLGGPPMQMPI